MERLATLVALVRLVDIFVKKKMVMEIPRAFQRCPADVAHGFGIRVSSPVRVQRLLMLQRLATNVADKGLAQCLFTFVKFFARVTKIPKRNK